MNELEQELLREEAGRTPPRLAVRSRTRIDTGRWWWPSRVWLCVMADELLMLAVARRRYVAKLSLDACGATHYCHATGELVVEPGEGLTISRFRVTPREALELLNIMGVSASSRHPVIES
jgi:hypothetical protein